ncbi:MAG: PD40 domain-containing protein [Bacteroidetes bacterium]|nr:PD40 domain-containing protein [Bacteroidota bacterium]
MEFGKNRIQYQTFNWTYFDFERFRVYLYEGGQEIARYAAVSVNRQLPILEKRLDFQLEDKIQVLVYNNQNDFKQSNLGLVNEDQYNVGGVTRIIGDKISIFFNGSHADLDRQIRAALAELMVNQMMYGGRTRDVVRNSTLLTLPDWFKNGLIAYISEGWTSDADNQVMDAIQNDRFYKFNQLTGKEATLAGHALWYYVADTYGEAVIPNLLYMTKVTRNADNAFLFVLGISSTNMIDDFTGAFSRRYMVNRDTARSNVISEPIKLKQKKQRHYFQLKVSPDGQKIIYATNEMSQIKVWYNTLGEKKHKRLLKLGPKIERLDDNNYPLLAWHPNNSVIAMLYEKKNVIRLHTIDLDSKESFKRPITGFEKINSFSFSSDGKRIVMSAVKKGKGQSDIFVFTLNNGGVEQITNDIWDDNNPVFVDNSKGIAFESNRQSDTIKSNEDAKYYVRITRNNDIFYYNYASKSIALYRVTNTPDVNETQPQEYGKGTISFLSDMNGIYNRFVGVLDSTISFVDTTEHFRYFFNNKSITNNLKNINEHQVNTRHTKIAEIYISNGKEMLTIHSLAPDEKPRVLKNTWFKALTRPKYTDPDKINIVNPVRKEEQTAPAKKDSSSSNGGIDFENYTLNGEKKKEQAKSTTGNTNATSNASGNPQDSIRATHNPDELKFPIQQNYYISFSTDQVVTQLDNSYLSTNYQKFTGGGSPVYLNPGLNALFKIGLSDLFEDYRITAGFRLTSTLNTEYLLSWENRVKRIDQQLVLHRQSFVKINSYYGDVAKIQTHDARYSWKLPFSEVSATRLSILYRNDRTVFAAVSDAALPKRDAYDNYGGARLEYIFDNTRKRGINLYNGTRLKLWAEYWRLIKTERHDLITFGFDARNYKKLHRDLIWANRLAGGSSWGTDRLIFYMGGVDNWINPQFDRSINIVNPDQYQFQTLATPMRGFKQNIRNGNNFVVWNSEIRVPIFRYLLNRPIRSDFINNFQINVFGDMGMAWYDKNPYSEDNVLNKNVYPGNPITLTIYNQKEPLVGGFGIGVRSRILGYFIRLDHAWGVDDKQIQKPMTYISLSTDF